MSQVPLYRTFHREVDIVLHTPPLSPKAQ
jgi:hypothetical protein